MNGTIQYLKLSFSHFLHLLFTSVIPTAYKLPALLLTKSLPFTTCKTNYRREEGLWQASHWLSWGDNWNDGTSHTWRVTKHISEQIRQPIAESVLKIFVCMRRHILWVPQVSNIQSAEAVELLIARSILIAESLIIFQLMYFKQPIVKGVSVWLSHSWVALSWQEKANIAAALVDVVRERRFTMSGRSSSRRPCSCCRSLTWPTYSTFQPGGRGFLLGLALLYTYIYHFDCDLICGAYITEFCVSYHSRGNFADHDVLIQVVRRLQYEYLEMWNLELRQWDTVRSSRRLFTSSSIVREVTRKSVSLVVMEAISDGNDQSSTENTPAKGQLNYRLDERSLNQNLKHREARI